MDAKAKFMRRKPKVIVALEEISEISMFSDRGSYAKIFCGLNVFKSFAVMKDLFVYEQYRVTLKE